MKNLILLIVMMAALLGCSKESEDLIIEEEVVNYLANTKWQSYMPILHNHYMDAKYLIFNEDETCAYIDSTGESVTKKIYYYDPVNGDPFDGAYYVQMYYNEAKTQEYELLIVQQNLEKLHYYWVMGDLGSVIHYKRIE